MTTLEGNSKFQFIENFGWSRGLRNLLRGELGGWFGSRKWWVQIIIWTLIINLILFLSTLDTTGMEEFAYADEQPFSSHVLNALTLFSVLTGVFLPIGVVILMQSAIIGEKKSGTAEWILAKPVTRTAFILAKLIANAVGIGTTIILTQGIIAYLIIALVWNAWLPIVPFLAGLLVQFIHILFYITLTLMLGALFNVRGPVLGFPIAFIFLQQLFLAIAPAAAYILPWTLSLPLNDGIVPAIAMGLVIGVAPFSYTPLLATLAFSTLFVAVAMCAFNRQEF